MYTVLTGSKNNAGDFLIKYRAKQLFKELRPDREIVDFNAWEYFDTEKLNIVNQSKALILLGGPSLQKNMRPKVYKMTKKLDDIKVPIITMGIGWKSLPGNWDETYNYPLSPETIELLERINNSGYLSSVRDYHTLNAVRFKNFDNFLMTGCPAYYDLGHIGKDLQNPSINKVAFSLGVSFMNSPSMEKLMKDNILQTKKHFEDKDFEVVFHHSLDEEKFLSSPDATKRHNQRHREFANWLKSQNISYTDVSGSAKNLMNYYADVDLHIGYRVHAHIFMNSISRFSILISEDGRAKGAKGVIGGIVLDGFVGYKNKLTDKVLTKVLSQYDRVEANEYLTKEIIDNANYEQKIDFLRIKNSRKQIDHNFEVMKQFLHQLP
ncbi:MAG: polysaccharide pyruvyl transferase family protein [Mesonia hippocampi]|uniref:polysaccharide pyruvyl transferase family protein n=1 Tax=Mesonia hippocampi TaxID=1628250 RepID=UPI003F981AEA